MEEEDEDEDYNVPRKRYNRKPVVVELFMIGKDKFRV